MTRENLNYEFFKNVCVSSEYDEDTIKDVMADYINKDIIIIALHDEIYVNQVGGVYYGEEGDIAFYDSLLDLEYIGGNTKEISPVYDSSIEETFYVRVKENAEVKLNFYLGDIESFGRGPSPIVLNNVVCMKMYVNDKEIKAMNIAFSDFYF